MELKAILGIAAVGLNILAFVPYIVDILRGKTKPHLYSWLIWALITGIVFIGQHSEGAGAGAWVTGITTCINAVICLLAFKWGTADITLSDKICLASALAILVLWMVSNSMLLSIVLVTIVDVLAFVPTIRKILKAPHQETFITYPISSIRCLLGIAAIANYSMVTYLYPIAMLAMYVLITGILLYVRPGVLRSLCWRIKRRRYVYYGYRKLA